MKKSLALIILSYSECFPSGGFSGGGHKVTRRFIEEVIKTNEYEIDIFAQKGQAQDVIEGINSVKVLGKKKFSQKLKNLLAEKKYDYLLSSDILLPFANNIIHSNSSPHKSKNGNNFIMAALKKAFNHKKIKNQRKNLPEKKTIFTVSEGLKKDFVENFKLDEKKVVAIHPAVDNYCEFEPPIQQKTFTIGSIVGGGINKGGYLLLLALKKLSKEQDIRAKVIFPKIKKSGFFKFTTKLLGLGKKIEILPRQANMQEYYKSIDCYILPSLNEAFGLVVTEAASNSKPSIVSSTTGVSELIKDNNNGFIFDRTKNGVNNLSSKISDVKNLYFENFDEFSKISKNAHEMSQKLSWKQFTKTILDNMEKEN